MTASLSFIRFSTFLPLCLVALAILVFALEFELVAGGVPVRSDKQKLLLEEVVVLGGLLTVAVAAMAFINRALMLRERAKRTIAERDSFTDPLTGLSNRRQFVQRAEQELAQALSKGAECALLLIDLDGFKPVNDVHGHAAGDAVLVEVARRLSDCLPDAASIARLGGDEFAVLLKAHAAPRQLARAAVGQFLDSLAEPVRHAGGKLEISASVGVAFGPSRKADLTSLLAAADEQMYQCKRNQQRVRQPASRTVAQR